MGKVQLGKEVDFPYYCRAFEALEEVKGYWGANVCSMLDDGEGAYSVDVMARDVPGDGYVSVPDYSVVHGRLAKSGRLILSEDGSITSERDDSTEPVTSLDALKAKYFIAGAFGLDEVQGGRSLDQGIVAGLQKLYRACREDWERCMDSPAALAVREGWQRIVDAKNELAAKTRAVEGLKREYKTLADGVNDKKALSSRVAYLEETIPGELRSVRECAEAEKKLGEMIAIAREFIDREAREAAAASEEQRKRQEIDRLNGLSDGIWTDAEKYLGMARASNNPFVHESSIEKPMASYRSYQFYPGYRDSVEAAQIRYDNAVKMMTEIADTWTGFKYFEDDHCVTRSWNVGSCITEYSRNCYLGIRNQDWSSDSCKKSQSISNDRGR